MAARATSRCFIPLTVALGLDGFSSHCFWLWLGYGLGLGFGSGLGRVRWVALGSVLCRVDGRFWVELEPHKFLVSSRSSSLNACFSVYVCVFVCVCVSHVVLYVCPATSTAPQLNCQ